MEIMKTVEYQKRIEHRLVGRFRILEADADSIDQQLQEKHRDEPHGNSKGVIIWGTVDDCAYSKRIAEHGAKPITEGYFSSARAASMHFGYHWDAVGQALHRASLKGKDIAVIAGVPVRWADDVPGLD